MSLEDGRATVPAFELMARRFLDADFAPEAVAERTGIAASAIRRLATELAHAAFEEEIVVEIPWTDWAGRHQERMVGRPVSMHAMRGISAHANGFHTARAIHDLQMILGTIDTPGGFRFQPPYPRPIPPAPAGPVAPMEPLSGPPLGFPRGPEDLLVEADGTPQRIDKAFSWNAPLAVHGIMQMVIANAANADPYPIDTLMLSMANMSWNSSMNLGGVHNMLTEADPASGEYRIPHIIYSDAFFSEMVAYADLVLPDTTYLERHDCAARPPHLRRRRSRRFDPPPGARAGPRRSPLPGRASRSRGATRASRHGESRWRSALSGRVSRLHGEPRAQARHRLAGRLARRDRR